MANARLQRALQLAKVNLRKRSTATTKQQEQTAADKSKRAVPTSKRKQKKKQDNVETEPQPDKVEEINDKEKPAKRRRKAKKTKDEMTFAPRLIGAVKRIGAHVSTAGGIDNAVLNARAIGANAFQIFVRSQRRWECKPTPADVRDRFIQECKTHGYTADDVLVHGSYLINLANPDADKWEKSYLGFLDEIQRTHDLGLKLYNFHPGSTRGSCSIEDGCASIAMAINRVHKQVPSVVCVIEIMAGGGQIVGGKYAHLKSIISNVEDKSRLGVCLDTCHMFAAGYDIRSDDAWNKSLDEFDKVVGLKYLKAMHLNDSKTDIGSHRDRHENIGKGFIKTDAFKAIIRDPRTNGIPMVLETPVPIDDEDKNVYAEEIAQLYSFCKNGQEKAKAKAKGKFR
ncbi:DNA-(apurinic or apyrimidinic site) lyase [Umbelopsis nana]